MTPQLLRSSTGNLLANLDQSTFDAKFNRSPFTIGHHLSDHPLFSLPRLIELAQKLPAKKVEYNSGELPVSQDPTKTPLNGLSIPDTIRRIEECRSWMVLKNVELDEEYSDLLGSCLAEIRGLSDHVSPGMKHQAGFIFISSPGSVTPYHIDPENNFLLQIRGRKTVHMFPQNDREILTEENLEAFFTGGHRNLPFEDWYNTRSERFELLAGDGLHFPVAAPHWVQNGPEVSISFSVTFQTKDSTDRRSLHRLNKSLRKLGVKPSNVGASALRDRMKLAFVGGVRAAKRIAGMKDAK
ncbi:MAG: cupin-like domain-containing protein [Planctomycetia bacterium]|nr:cupin-like domain-containing protein [Planctomycetia bacterium]